MIEIRGVTDEELEAWRGCVVETFGNDLDMDPTGDTRIRALIDPAQRWGAFDGKHVVGTAATLDLHIELPGGDAIHTAGLTMVTVRPSHRRRGILRGLIDKYIDDLVARGYPMGALWASEATIYGRFGFGLAAEHEALTIQNARALTVRADAFDELQWLSTEEARELLPAIYAKATKGRPGAVRRTSTWWRERRFLEAPWVRGGASLRRHVAVRRAGELVGYIAFRQRHTGELEGNVEIIELHGIDARAEATLWRFALGVDLFQTVKWGNAPGDDILPLVLSDYRGVERSRTDNIWLYLRDVSLCLAARTYAADGTLRLSIEGTTYELVVENGVGRCAPTDASADLLVDRSGLASLYLGAFSATRLVRACVIRGESDKLALADRMFATSRTAWCAEVF